MRSKYRSHFGPPASRLASRIFYQRDPLRMSTCPVMVHGLLHIADGIEATGPVWAAWAFVIKRYCGYVKRNTVRSRKHALASIDNRILETTQLEIAKMRYGLTKKLSLKPKRGRTSKDKFPDCESRPHRRLNFQDNDIQQILNTLCCIQNEHFLSIPVFTGSFSI